MPNALILTPDFLPCGVYTIPRGEGRWTLNVTELLAKAGYEVDIVNFPGEPILDDEYKDKQPEGINWLTTSIDDLVSIGKRYDVYYCHFPIYLEDPVKWNKVAPVVDKSLFGTWWPKAVSSWLTRWNAPLPPRSTPVTPFRAHTDSLTGWTVHCIPLGHIDQFKPPQFANKKIVWTCKRPMTNDRGNEKFRTNLYHLRSSYELSLLGYPVTVLCHDREWLANTPDAPPVDKDLWHEAQHYYKALQQRSNVEWYPYMPLDKFLTHIASGSITLPLDCSSAIPHTALYGVVPALFTDWGMEFIKRPTLERLGTDKYYSEYTYQEVYDKLYNLLTDESYYNNQLDILRSKCPYYTTDQAVNLLKNAIEDIK